MLASIIFVLFILAVTLSVMLLAGRFTAEYAPEARVYVADSDDLSVAKRFTVRGLLPFLRAR